MKMQTVEDFMNSPEYKQKEKDRKLLKEKITKEVNRIIEKEKLSLAEKECLQNLINTNNNMKVPWNIQHVAKRLASRGILSQHQQGRFSLVNIKKEKN